MTDTRHPASAEPLAEEKDYLLPQQVDSDVGEEEGANAQLHRELEEATRCGNDQAK